MHHARACALEKRVQNYCFFLTYARKNSNILGIRTNDAVLQISSTYNEKTQKVSDETFGGIKNYTYLCNQKGNYAYIVKDFRTKVLLLMDEHLPIHVHVEHGGKLAKMELEPEIRVVYNHGLKEGELKMAVDTCKIYGEQFIEEWHRRIDEL